MMPNSGSGCLGLFYLRRSREYYNGQYGDYFDMADFIYNVLCVDPTTTPTPTGGATSRPPADHSDCGKSDSLMSLHYHDSAESTEGGAAAGTAGGGAGVERRIVGGVSAQDCSVLPWQVRLQVGMFLCGGSILSDRHVLTAAHCLDDVRKLEQVEVILADVDALNQDPYEQKAPLRNITLHENYDPVTYTSDIAILTLKEPIQFTHPCVGKICTDPHFQFDGRDCTVSGWGIISVDWRESPELQMVKVRAHKAENCQVEFDIQQPNYIFDKQRMMCAGQLNGDKDACQGDSGGALVCPDSLTGSFVQVGIVSHGLGCGEAGLPGIYTNVAFYQDWIDQIMAENDY